MTDEIAQAQQNKRTVMRLVGVGVLMGALAWASVPLYDLFCRVTGFGGTPLVAETGADTVLDQTIEVRFDASLASDMPWDFRPMERTMTIRLGETALAFYEAHNPTNMPVAGSASFNVAPFAAGGYFTKIDCFCFEEQVLQPGETVQMPVSFYVDPEILEDEEGKHVPTITLSYTFHVIDLPQDPAALDVLPAGPVN
ncbi:MAG: cytochrome c oxidase assembly protein [Pseudomonadota bacterium]